MTKTQERPQEQETTREFFDLVNMTPHALSTWLDTPESQSVGQTREGDSESIGHQSGRAIVSLLEQPKRHQFNDREVDQMKRTISYIKRHLAQRPKHADEHSRWAQSLKNWGHDPDK